MKAHLYRWSRHWLVTGDIPHNESHRHISASVLLGLLGEFELSVNGVRRHTRAAIVAPEVEQSLSAPNTPLLIVHCDPDSEVWQHFKYLLMEEDSVDIPPPSQLSAPLSSLNSQAGDARIAAQLIDDWLGELGTRAQALDPRIADTCAYLRQHLPERIDLEVLAERIHLSTSRLTHLFREETGVSLQRFLLHLKMLQAIRLWQPGMTLSALAADAGFYDQPHLARTVRAMFDALPSSLTQEGALRVHHCEDIG